MTQQFSCTEQTGSHATKQQYNIQLLFKIKHSVLLPPHESQKRDKYKLFRHSFSQEHLMLIVFITHI